jgi:hypothetical protein
LILTSLSLQIYSLFGIVLFHESRLQWSLRAAFFIVIVLSITRFLLISDFYSNLDQRMADLSTSARQPFAAV